MPPIKKPNCSFNDFFSLPQYTLVLVANLCNARYQGHSNTNKESFFLLSFSPISTKHTLYFPKKLEILVEISMTVSNLLHLMTSKYHKCMGFQPHNTALHMADVYYFIALCLMTRTAMAVLQTPSVLID